MARSKKKSPVAIEALTTEQQFRDAVALQKTIWGFDEIELVPVRLFVVATKVGGQVFGAYSDGRLVAFCLALPGLKPGPKSFLHSQMLGVLPEYQGRGIDALMYYHTAIECEKCGIRRGEASWVLEDNTMMNRAAELMNAEKYKTYRIYEMPV